ncbi:uncharacterized protein [Elaeis guineensis]|uniref:Uncharacterized protein LOC105046751 n=1 Tax=Elaeis guineensis var. tenera TaxID=51953 RepID=A0A6I9RCP3_ELAGV|nr:uncharacterized protein LOC105046751 [Elaeis guineensis]XP_010923747.1 uncharacterized protein LOC105046751 [Elaeis guineensis]
MALLAHQTQGSYSIHSLRPKALTHEVRWGSFVAFQFSGRKDKSIPLKLQFHFRGQPVILLKGKAFKVSSFKGNAQNDEREGRDSSSKFPKAPVQLSAQQEREEILSDSHDVQKHSLSYAPEVREETTAGSLAIQKLFRKWLIMLRTQTPSLRMDGNFHEEPAENVTIEGQHVTIRMRAGNMLKAALVYFLGLDAAISVPLLIFIPWYLTVKLVYGVEVTKELTPLWVLGPLIVAFYIKIIQGLCLLYLFLFMQASRLIKNLPIYSSLVYTYIAPGKLKAFIWALFWKPIIDIKNLDYKALLRQKFKQLEEWALEKYLDFIELIWPYYCRTIRFLKKAHFI